MEKLSKLQDKDYQTIFGVTKNTFDCMLKILEQAYAKRHKKGGRRLSKLSLSDKLAITLVYYREYRPVRNIAFDWGVSKSIIHDSIKWVEEVLVKNEKFSLPSKRELNKENAPLVVLMDVTECEIQRPKKNKKILQRQKEETHFFSSSYCKCRKQRHNLYISSIRA